MSEDSSEISSPLDQSLNSSAADPRRCSSAMPSRLNFQGSLASPKVILSSMLNKSDDDSPMMQRIEKAEEHPRDYQAKPRSRSCLQPGSHRDKEGLSRDEGKENEAAPSKELFEEH